MLNNLINIDLHIHSDASRYKDSEEIVKDSNLRNVTTLLDSLMEHNISLFSITDHNRFNNLLYEELYQKLEEKPYKGSLYLLHGVEFDVKFNPDMNAAHIVTLFDLKHKSDRYKIINAINDDKLVDKSESYCTNRFEQLLKKIGLNVLLIVHQKKSLDNNSGNHASLSDSTDEPYKIIKVGYVDALEYQKPNVEGIIKSNLRDFDYEIPLVTGSDCHEWKYYPKHNNRSTTKIEHFTKIKALPTFKGLHLTLSSPKTRLNRFKNNKIAYIDHINVNNKKVPLDPSLNAIIGENGSGKSSILEILNDTKLKNYIKTIKKDNNITFKYDGHPENIKYIYQSQIIEKFNSKNLLDNDNTNYKDINHEFFETAFNNYAKRLKRFIETNIKKNTKLESMSNVVFMFDEVFTSGTFYISVIKNNSTLENNHEERLDKLKTIVNHLIIEFNEDYYSTTEKEILKNTLIQVRTLYLIILEKYINKKNEITIRNKIDSNITTYTTSIKGKQTTLDTKITQYNNEKNNLKNTIVEAITFENYDNKLPDFPAIFKGFSSNQNKGFKFNKEAYYNNKNLEDDFLKEIFNTNFRSFDTISKIINKTSFAESVTGANESNLNTQWKNNLEKFFTSMKEEKRYILEETAESHIGNTLGELSVAYYKFNLQEEDSIHVFFIDQPEDNISNLRISNELITFINSIRDEKQVIFVTHNPLLVVNLDVDNVLYLEKHNNKINVISGCLEDEENNILEHISNQMDGGKEMIKKRLNIYG